MLLRRFSGVPRSGTMPEPPTSRSSSQARTIFRTPTYLPRAWSPNASMSPIAGGAVAPPAVCGRPWRCALIPNSSLSKPRQLPRHPGELHRHPGERRDLGTPQTTAPAPSSRRISPSSRRMPGSRYPADHSACPVIPANFTVIPANFTVIPANAGISVPRRPHTHLETDR